VHGDEDTPELRDDIRRMLKDERQEPQAAEASPPLH
jgi:hypothetical protein